jgi:predicted ribosome-associated RNA-binding protein Tma20
LAADAKVSCHGKTCKTEDLKAGMAVRVTTKEGDKNVATHVEATEKKDACANTHDGKVVSVSGDKLTTTCGDGKQHSHTVAKDAKVTCDGTASKASDLKAGTPVRVTTHKDDKTVATAVESGKHIPAVSHKA